MSHLIELKFFSDIIFFGEGLPDTFYQNLDTDKHEVCIWSNFFFNVV